ncbi:MAG: ankyrin repeat domain-containing protein [Halobacteriovoraceae bacterium]|nr:ankyrin repeat domain-containing protein [Halobacteriovoraceae bacterium]
MKNFKCLLVLTMICLFPKNGICIEFYETLLTGQAEKALQLLKENSSIAYSLYDQNLTTLHLAAQHGEIEVIKELLAIDPKFIKMRDSTYDTAYDLAVFFESSEVASYLLDVDPSLAYPSEKQKHPSVNFAAKWNNVELLSKIAEIDINILKIDDIRGWSPIHHAVANKSRQAAHFILRHLPFEAHVTTKKNETPLHLAAIENDFEIARSLIEVTKDDPTYLGISDTKNETVLHKAARIGNIQLIKLILRYNSKIKDLRNIDGLTASEIARKKQDFRAAAVIENRSYLFSLCQSKFAELF